MCDICEEDIYDCNCIIVNNKEGLTKKHFKKYHGLESYLWYEKTWEENIENKIIDSYFNDYEYPIRWMLINERVCGGNLKNIDYWVTVNFDYAETMIKILEYWKLNPPKQSVLDDFKYIINNYCEGRKKNPIIYRFFIPNFTKEVFLPLMDLLIYFGLDFKNLYNKKSVLEILIDHIDCLDKSLDIINKEFDVVESIEEDIVFDYKNIIIDDIKLKTYLYFCKVCNDNNLKYCDLFGYVKDYDLKMSINLEINSENNRFDSNYTNYIESFDKVLSLWVINPPPKKILETFIKTITENDDGCYGNPEIIFSILSNINDFEMNLRIITNLKKLGYKNNYFYQSRYVWGDMIDCINDYKYWLEYNRDKIIKALASQIIVKAVKNALNDKYILTKLRYNIEYTRAKKLLD
jgi:hypothetical protein